MSTPFDSGNDAPQPASTGDTGEHRALDTPRTSLYRSLDDVANGGPPRRRPKRAGAAEVRLHAPLWQTRGPLGLVLCAVGLHLKVRPRRGLLPICARCRWEAR